MSNLDRALYEHYHNLKKQENKDFSVLTAACRAVVYEAELRRVKRLFYISSFGFALSAGVCGWGVSLFVHDVVTSGVSQLFSMIFSDFASVSAYWSDFAYSLAESLPFMSTLIVISAALASVVSLRTAFLTRFIYTKELKAYGKN